MGGCLKAVLGCLVEQRVLPQSSDHGVVFTSLQQLQAYNNCNCLQSSLTKKPCQLLLLLNSTFNGIYQHNYINYRTKTGCTIPVAINGAWCTVDVDVYSTVAYQESCQYLHLETQSLIPAHFWKSGTTVAPSANRWQSTVSTGTKHTSSILLPKGTCGIL